jgi:rhamnosyl/mannosyltransferase
MSRKIREKYKTPKMLLFVGRLRYFKGLRYLIEAMKSIDAKLLIIGTGPEEHFLKTLSSKRGLNEKIVFLGDIADSDLPTYYDACDIFVLPSSHRSEAFGTVLIEAMASGKAVISTELGTGTSFVNMHGKTGFVVPPKNSNSLAEAINKLLTDDSLRKEFEVNSKKRSEEFSKERLNERITELYAEVLKGQSSGGHL